MKINQTLTSKVIKEFGGVTFPLRPCLLPTTKPTPHSKYNLLETKYNWNKFFWIFTIKAIWQDLLDLKTKIYLALPFVDHRQMIKFYPGSRKRIFLIENTFIILLTINYLFTACYVNNTNICVGKIFGLLHFQH